MNWKCNFLAVVLQHDITEYEIYSDADILLDIAAPVWSSFRGKASFAIHPLFYKMLSFSTILAEPLSCLLLNCN